MRLPRGQVIRPQEDTREHWLPNAGELFAGSDGGAEHWVIIASLIETALCCAREIGVADLPDQNPARSQHPVDLRHARIVQGRLEVLEHVRQGDAVEALIAERQEMRDAREHLQIFFGPRCAVEAIRRSPVRACASLASASWDQRSNFMPAR
jgi:hypothetical protein